MSDLLEALGPRPAQDKKKKKKVKSKPLGNDLEQIVGTLGSEEEVAERSLGGAVGRAGPREDVETYPTSSALPTTKEQLLGKVESGPPRQQGANGETWKLEDKKEAGLPFNQLVRSSPFRQRADSESGLRSPDATQARHDAHDTGQQSSPSASRFSRGSSFPPSDRPSRESSPSRSNVLSSPLDSRPSVYADEYHDKMELDSNDSDGEGQHADGASIERARAPVASSASSVNRISGPSKRTASQLDSEEEDSESEERSPPSNTRASSTRSKPKARLPVSAQEEEDEDDSKEDRSVTDSKGTTSSTRTDGRSSEQKNESATPRLRSQVQRPASTSGKALFSFRLSKPRTQGQGERKADVPLSAKGTGEREEEKDEEEKEEEKNKGERVDGNNRDGEDGDADDESDDDKYGAQAKGKVAAADKVQTTRQERNRGEQPDPDNRLKEPRTKQAAAKPTSKKRKQRNGFNAPRMAAPTVTPDTTSTATHSNLSGAADGREAAKSQRQKEHRARCLEKARIRQGLPRGAHVYLRFWKYPSPNEGWTLEQQAIIRNRTKRFEMNLKETDGSEFDPCPSDSDSS